MRLLPFLLSLVGAAVASHDTCYYLNKKSDFTNYVEVQVRDTHTLMYRGYDTFSKLTKMFVFKDPKGTIYVNKDAGFSANWNGQDWGGFSFQKEKRTKTYVIKYGCYDTSNVGYCKNDENYWRGCQRSMVGYDDIGPENSRRVPRALDK